MKKHFFKTIGSILIVGLFVFLAIGSGDSKSDSKKTSFDSIEEARDYIHYKDYKALVENWGEANYIGEPYIYGDKVIVTVRWDNIKLMDEPMEIRFENAEMANVRDDGSFEKWPTRPNSIWHDGTGYGW